jgi:hypothetical protein
MSAAIPENKSMTEEISGLIERVKGLKHSKATKRKIGAASAALAERRV